MAHITIRRNTFIRLYVAKELDGLLPNDLALDEWAAWIRLQLFCAKSPYQPKIQIKPHLGFTDSSLAGYLKVPLDVWLRAKAQLRRRFHIIVENYNVIKITSWDDLNPQTKKTINPDMVPGAWGRAKDILTKVEREKYEFVKEVVTFMKEKSGKTFSPRSEPTLRVIIGRQKEGATLDQFRHVISLKWAQWKNTDLANLYKPHILFAKGVFWGYVNETATGPSQKHEKAEILDSLEPRERELVPKWEREYNRYLQRQMDKNSWATYKEIDWLKTMTEADFIKQKAGRAKGLRKNPWAGA